MRKSRKWKISSAKNCFQDKKLVKFEKLNGKEEN